MVSSVFGGAGLLGVGGGLRRASFDCALVIS